jgi:membrane fusion protein (multidrug efflux system)
VYPQPARVLFSDLQVDPTSGQVTVRAEVPNPQNFLLPGMYVRVRLEQAKASNAILLPQQAVTRSGQGDSVLVLDQQGHLQPRNVKVGGAQEGNWIILDGLKAGEQVVVDGTMKLQMLPPNTPVKPVPWKTGAATPAAAGASAPASASKGAASAAGTRASSSKSS